MAKTTIFDTQKELTVKEEGLQKSYESVISKGVKDHKGRKTKLLLNEDELKNLQLIGRKHVFIDFKKNPAQVHLNLTEKDLHCFRITELITELEGGKIAEPIDNIQFVKDYIEPHHKEKISEKDLIDRYLKGGDIINTTSENVVDIN